MNILMLAHRFPFPPTRGDQVRAWCELKHLADHHNVWFACVDTQPPNPNYLAHVRACCCDVAVETRPGAASLAWGAWGLLRGRSLTESYLHDDRLAQTLRRWAETVDFDAVLTFSSGMAPYAELVNARRRVLDMNDADSFKFRMYSRRTHWPLSALYGAESRRLAAREMKWSRSHDVTLFVNERERRKLSRRPGAPPTKVFRTCIYPRGDIYELPPTTPERPIVGFVGSMFYPPNIRAVNWFGRYVWPLLRRETPQAEWWIVGAKPHKSVRAWAKEPGVTVTGFVPQIEPYLRQIRAFINPVHGDLGVQTKLIMAMAAGKACIVTPDTAAGIDYDVEAPFLVSSTPDAFARSVAKVLTDDALAGDLARRSRLVFNQFYNAERQMAQLEAWLRGDDAKGDFVPETKVHRPAAVPHVPAEMEPVNA